MKDFLGKNRRNTLSEYIWLDKEGKEVKREAKGRGRPKAGAVERDDGNFYITDGIIFIPVKKNIVSTATKIVHTDEEEDEQDYSKLDRNDDEDEVDNSAPTELSIDKVKCFREPNKIKLKDFLKCCFVDTKDFIVSDDKIILNNMILIGDAGLINLNYNSLYQRLEIDKKENTIKVWGVTKMWQDNDTKEWFPDPSGPSFYIKDLFSSFEMDEVK
jgi:hypothetical protein